MMKKQEFVPRKISEKPLYELKSVEDLSLIHIYSKGSSSVMICPSRL